MGTRALVLVVVLLLAGCTRVVDDARPQRERPVAPIAAGQIEDLLSKNAQGGDAGDSLFAKVEPADCAGVVQEVRAPFIFGSAPVAHSGGYFFDDKAEPAGNIVEIVGVYYADFDPGAAVAHVERTIEACQDDVVRTVASNGDEESFVVRPRSDSGSPQIVLWSLTDGTEWACDNAFVAKYNAAVEITACATTHGYDVLALANAALKRIEQLANAAV